MWIVVAVLLLFGLVVFRGAPYVPSHKKEVRRAFRELYPLGSHDTLVDIGSGDGVILRLAAKQGAHAVGYELNPLLVGVSWLLSRRNPLVRVRLVDFWLTKLPDDTTVVYAFMVTRDVKKMVKKLQSEADRRRRPLHLILYGNVIPTRQPVKIVSAFRLYRFDPS